MRFLSTFFRRKRPVSPSTSTDDSVYRLLAEQASDVLFHLGPEGLVTYVSPSVERMLGYRQEQVIGTDAVSLTASV